MTAQTAKKVYFTSTHYAGPWHGYDDVLLHDPSVRCWILYVILAGVKLCGYVTESKDADCRAPIHTTINQRK